MLEIPAIPFNSQQKQKIYIFYSYFINSSALRLVIINEYIWNGYTGLPLLNAFPHKSVAPLLSRWFDDFLKQSRPKLRTCNTSQTDPKGSGCPKKKNIAAFFGIFVFRSPSLFYSLYPTLLPEPLSSWSFWPTILPENEQKHWQFSLVTFSSSHTQTSITPSTKVRWTCDQVTVRSPHCPRCF